MKKRIISALICLVMVISCLPQVTLFARAATSGTCGDNLTWTLDSSGTLTISGTGTMTNWSSSRYVPWYSSRSSIKSVVIGDSVTTIGYYAFYDCRSLTSIEIGDSVTTIGNYAFYYCNSLTSVEIPDSVTTIGDWAFYSCDSLTSVEIPDSVTTIGSGAFRDCRSLTSVEIPDSVTTIGSYAFNWCDSLTSINVDENNRYYCDVDGVLFNKNKTTIIQYAIGKSDTYYKIPDSVTTIGEHAFSYCDSLTSVVIPDSVTTIGNSAFECCYSLTSVEIGDGVTTIGDYAFYSCDSLVSVEIGDSVTTIGDRAFYGCYGLTDVYYSGSETEWNQINIGNRNTPLTYATIHYNYVGNTNTVPTISDDNNENDPRKIAEAMQANLPTAINDGIVINRSGKAYAYFALQDAAGNPLSNKSVTYHFGNGSQSKTAKTNANGIVTVETDTLTVSGKSEETRTMTVIFTNSNLLQNTFEFDVTITPAEYTQTWNGAVGAGLSSSVGKVVKATGGLEFGKTIEVKEKVKKDGRDLSLSRGDEFSADLSAKLGIEYKALTFAEAKLLGLGTEYRLNSGYYIEDYDPKNPEHLLNVEMFLLDTMLSLDSSNAIPKMLFEQWAEKNEIPAINEKAQKFGLSGEAGVTAGEFNLGDDTFKFDFGGINAEGKVSWTQKENYNGQTVTTSGIEYGNSGHLLDVGYKNTASKGVNYIDSGTTLLAGNWNTTDISFTAVSPTDDMRDLQSASMKVLLDSANLSSYGNSSEITHTKEIKYTGEAAKQVADKTDYMREVGYGGFVILTPQRAKEMVAIMSAADERGTVAVEREKTKGFNYDLSIGIEDDLSVNLGISGTHKYSYDNETGIIRSGVEYIQASNNIDSYIEKNANSFGKIVKEASDEFANIFKDFFESVTASIKDGINKAKVTVKNALKNTWDGFITVITLGNVNVGSYAIMTMEADDGPISVSTTVGEPYIISVSDNDGNEITDFGDNVLEISIAFDEDDFAVAGIDYSDDMISLLKVYRWDEESAVYLAEESEINLAGCCVNATVSKPGQYILALDNGAPSVDNFSVSAANATPTITATVADMSGIGEFAFAIDGETIVDTENFAKYYDTKTGVFAYKVNTPLASGAHVASIQATDTSGNAMAAPITLTFAVDDIAPQITSVDVPEFTDSDAVTITATANDEQLTTLIAEVDYAGIKVSKAMTETDGVWSAEIDGLPKFARFDVRVYAYDAAGNCTVSDAMTSIIAKKVSDDVYLGVLEYTKNGAEVLINNTTGEPVSANLVLNAYDSNDELTETLTKQVTIDIGYITLLVEPQSYHHKIRVELSDADGNQLCTGFSAFSNADGETWATVGQVTAESVQLNLRNKQAGKCIVSVYNRYGKMLTCGMQDVAEMAGNVTVNYDAFSNDGGCTLKVFMMDSSFAPINKSVEVALN